MSVLLKHPRGEVVVKELPDGRKEIKSSVWDASTFVPSNTWVTGYDIELLRLILDVKGPAWICDEIKRDEDAAYVENVLITDLLAYFDPKEIAGKRILDFGSGSGASSMILARHFPNASIVGVELDGRLVEIAKARMAFYKHSNVSFLVSPNGNELPQNIGKFDFVIMSAVYEHLLPEERKTVMPLVWSAIKPQGFLFLDQTPNRAFPLELHSTLLPLINYMPRSLALIYARAFSNKIDPKDSWEQLLREGIRGATVGEIVANLKSFGAKLELLTPSRNGLTDRIDLFYSKTDLSRHTMIKKSAWGVLKGLRMLTGIELITDLTLALRKES
jgi:2-polyprenyl-3-methyl-5-hydroxy-6-metoxy-1,4-benzoquinol methylase